MTAVATTLDGAPGGAALQTVEMSPPGGLLAAAAGREAAEWKREMSGLIDSSERCTSALPVSLDEFRRIDATGAP